MEVGLYAGSFDPVHLGHMAVIAWASQQLDRLVVVVAVNSQKQEAMFASAERVEMLSEACRDFANVVVAAHGGLLADVARRVGATLLVRGAGREPGGETQMAFMNGRATLSTVLVPSDPGTAFISSSRIRSLVAAGAFGAAAALVPANVAARIESGWEQREAAPL